MVDGAADRVRIHPPYHQPLAISPQPFGGSSCASAVSSSSRSLCSSPFRSPRLHHWRSADEDQPIIEGAPGHGEGHNSGMPMQIAAALAVKKVMEQQHLQGTLKIWPGVAEELLGTKAYYVRAGAFKDVDICIFAHVGAGMNVGWGDSGGNGMVSVEYDFKGESAHAAGAPWRRRSPLDCLQLMGIGWNFRREHLRLQQRSHYVIPNGGDQPNVVPPNASVWYYFRETSYDEVKKLWEIGNNMAKAATMMTDTEYTMRVLGSAWPGHFNKTVAEVMHANIEKVGLPG